MVRSSGEKDKTQCIVLRKWKMEVGACRPTPKYRNVKTDM